MELPFLKNKQNQGGGGPDVEKTRESDKTSDEALMESIGQELLDAISRKDIGGIRSALEALVSMIKGQE